MADTINIAPAAGLPDILFGAVSSPVTALVSDALSIIGLLSAAPWGVYMGGAPVVVADTVIEVGRDKGYTVSDYPIEQGGFASYDKVELPYEASIRFASGGSADVRQSLISSIEGVLGDLNLYDVVTPDAVYPNGNFIREEYRRNNTDGGSSLLQIDVRIQEVRILSGQSTAQNTADPSSADQTNGGTVQPSDPTSAQSAAVDTPTSSVASGTASETAASGATAAGAGYTSVPLPPERPATLQPSAPLGQGGIGHA